MRAAFHTLGCKVNQYETEAVKEAFVSRGAEIVGEEESADVYVVNTCTVTNIADRKSRQYIRRMKELNPDAIMIVTGCYAQVAADEVESMPEVDLVIGNSLKTEIADAAFRLFEDRPQAASGSHVLAFDQLTCYEDMGIVTADESAMSRAYIKIEEGCNRFCSYCLIPYARGAVRSRAPEDIISEAEALAGKGIREMVLTGINTALYGTEPGFGCSCMPGEEGLSGLETVLKRLDETPGDFRIRLSSLEPTVVDRDHVEKIIRYSRLCHHLHLSAQSGSDSVLKRMNRNYDRRDYLEIVKAIRGYDPLYGITTDIIVGFPGETDADFEDTLDLVKKAEFGRVHVFRYSPRRGTAGAKLPGAVPGEVKNRRAAALQELADSTARSFNEKNLGSEHIVLTEREQDGFMTGYTGSYIKAYIPCGEGCPEPGSLVRVCLTDLMGEGCRAEVLR